MVTHNTISTYTNVSINATVIIDIVRIQVHKGLD